MTKTKGAGARVHILPAVPMRGVAGLDSICKSEPEPAADDIIAKMSSLELRDEQVISMVRGLPAERKRTALLALVQDAQGALDERLCFGEAQLRRMCAERGLDWDRMSEDERESFVDTLLHEK